MRYCHAALSWRRRVSSGVKWLAVILALAACDAPLASPAAQHPSVEAGKRLAPHVTIGKTAIAGIEDERGIAAFLGVPFAEPPVGDARWRRPVPWSFDGGKLDATQFAPACMQSGSGLDWYHGMMRRVGVDPSLMAAPIYSEDCLYLNLWTELDSSQDGDSRSDNRQIDIREPRPVLIFIHGGSNTGGWSYEPNYHGAALAAQGVVVVTVAYRLGVFGWMNHPQMALRNLALHDLALALSWVHSHVARFGGDPERITVSGESAGAANALHLALSPLSGEKLSGIIHQSGGWPVVEGATSAEAHALALALQHSLLGSTGSLDGLRGVPAQALMERAAEVYSGVRFGAIQDAESLPRTLQHRVAVGDVPPLDIIIGTNANESLMYIRPEATAASYLGGRVPPHRWSAVLSSLGDGIENAEIFDRLGTALTFTCPSLSLATAIALAGGRSWVYRFDRVRPGFEGIGAYHGAELPYVFDRHDAWLPTDETDRTLTKMMLEYWQGFISRGEPNGQDLLTWPLWQVHSQQAVIFSEASNVMAHPDVALCEVLSSD